MLIATLGTAAGIALGLVMNQAITDAKNFGFDNVFEYIINRTLVTIARILT